MTNTSNKKKKKRGVSIKACIVMLAVVMLLGCAIGSTVAWLISTTDTVTNTFTYGDINIKLWETEDGTLNGKETSTRNDIKIIPGVNQPKNPTVKVFDGSENCYLFVKVDEQNWPDATYTDTDEKTQKKVSYSIADGWAKLEGETNVYYRVVDSIDTDKEFPVLKENMVYVSDTLDKNDIAELDANGKIQYDSNGKMILKAAPSLTFTAYAVQKDGIADAAAAWAKLPRNLTNQTPRDSHWFADAGRMRVPEFRMLSYGRLRGFRTSIDKFENNYHILSISDLRGVQT